MPTQAGKLGLSPYRTGGRGLPAKACECNAVSASGIHLFRFDLCIDLVQLPSFLGLLYKAVQYSGEKGYTTHVGITVQDQDSLLLSCVTLGESLSVFEFPHT